MRRLLSIAVLAGTALAFAGGAQPPRVAAAPNPCQKEGQCTIKKPLLAFVLESSTAMNQPFDADRSRWETAVDLIHDLVDFDNGYLPEVFILGLLRFGHDPNPAVPGTKIPGDSTGLVDGVKLDVPWYAPGDPNKAYGECTQGDEILAILDALPAPLDGADKGIGTWTRGALLFVQSYLATTVADHPDDLGERRALLVVLTTGAWTDPTGTQQQVPAEQSPTLVAADLYAGQDTPTYVVALGGPGLEPLADALASAGGTVQAHDAAPFPDALIEALKSIIVLLQTEDKAPVCVPDVPRVMVLLDASSSMLNDGVVKAAQGEGSWDLVRGKLAGADSVFDIVVGPNIPASYAFHFGLSVFGSADEERLLVQYGACNESRFQWALDPVSACDPPGCVDPYSAGPIKWTFKDGSLIDPPGFDAPTFNHMPQCDESNQDRVGCFGSDNAMHLGLQLVHTNVDTYRAECLGMGAMFPCNETTPFLNVLITDGAYDSTDAQVKAPLMAMHLDGIVTHVIGFGDALDLVQLDKLADWGSGGLLDPSVAQTQGQLEAAFQAILVPPVFDPCCSFTDCDSIVEETAGEESDTAVSTSGTSDGSSTGAVEPGTDASGTGTASDTGASTSAGSDTTVSDGDPTEHPDDTGVSATADPPTTDDSGASTPTGGGPATTVTGDGSGESTETDEEPSESASDKGCLCTSSADTAPTGSLLLLGLIGLLGVRRRPTVTAVRG